MKPSEKNENKDKDQDNNLIEDDVDILKNLCYPQILQEILGYTNRTIDGFYQISKSNANIVTTRELTENLEPEALKIKGEIKENKYEELHELDESYQNDEERNENFEFFLKTTNNS